MKTFIRTLTAVALSCVTALSAGAAEQEGANALRVATGPKGKGYSRLFADIQTVCGQRVPLTEVNTTGGLQNLTALAANQADLGMAQLDTLQELRGSDDSIASLQAVMPLNMNLLHVVAPVDGYNHSSLLKRVSSGFKNRELIKVSDLRGFPVAVVGSARTLGRVLDRRHGMIWEFVDVETDDQALDKIRKGEVAAMLSTSGWPNGPVFKLKRNAGMRLLSFDYPVQPPYQIVRKNYENLDTFNHDFLASPNLLMTRPFSSGGPHAKAVAALQACLDQNLTRLQDGAFEPTWRDVRTAGDTFGWTRFSITKR